MPFPAGKQCDHLKTTQTSESSPWSSLSIRLAAEWRRFSLLTLNCCGQIPKPRNIFDNLRVLGAFRCDTNLNSPWSAVIFKPVSIRRMIRLEPSLVVVRDARPASKPTQRSRTTPRWTTDSKTEVHVSTWNVVYIITCRACTLSYIGETGRRLGDRFCEHLHSVTKKADLPVAKHFSSPGHTTGDMMVSVVNDGFTNTKERRRAEGRLIFRCKNLNPSGMNIEFNFI